MRLPRLRPAQEIENALVSMLANENLMGTVPNRRGEYRLDARLWSLGTITVQCIDAACNVTWVTEVPYAYHDTVMLVIQRAAQQCGQEIKG